jgi:hypothetical protein
MCAMVKWGKLRLSPKPETGLKPIDVERGVTASCYSVMLDKFYQRVAIE